MESHLGAEVNVQSDWNATSGDAFIKNKPTIPTVPTNVSAFTNDAGYTTNTGTITGIKMNGASKGTSGVVNLGTVITAHQDISGKQDKITSTNKLSYSLLSDTPTIPTVNNATLTITKNGTSAGTFTANASSNKTIEIGVPTKVSDLTNDAGYTTNTGTITGITMNGASKGTSGVVNLGTVITAHQDISGKENTSNKVTSLSSSSTDTQYPSAKCVYDLIGDIETLLQGV